MSEVELVEEETTRDALEAAFDAQDTVDESEETETETEAETETVEPMEETPETEGVKAEVPEAEIDDKAPNAWSPASRETWNDIPKAAQAEIAKREQQTSTAMRESAEARRFANSFGDMAQRYTGFISANSGNPLQEVEGLLQTASIMQSGTQVQKAEMAAKLITDYSVDISTLDDILVGQTPQNQVPDEVTQRLNHLENYFTQQQQQTQQQAQRQQQEIQQETNQFLADNEFANDLRPQMADFMDVAERQGVKIGLQEAYQRAIATRPDIQKILQDRTNSEQNQTAVTNARKAGVSVPQAGGQGGPPAVPNTIREALLDAWAE